MVRPATNLDEPRCNSGGKLVTNKVDVIGV